MVSNISNEILSYLNPDLEILNYRILKFNNHLYLNVLDVWEGYSDADDGSGIVVGEVEAFADFSPTNGDEEGAVDSALADGTIRCRLDYLTDQ